MNIYIGNLHSNACEAEILKMFQKFGDVHSVKIIMDRNNNQSSGFGFVQMEGQMAALNAIQSLDNINYMNQYLEVSEAMPELSSWL